MSEPQRPGRTRLIVLVALLAVLAVSAALLEVRYGWISAPFKGPPNVVIVVSDTLRRDHLGLYGYSRDTSATLDALAEDALVFERAYTQSPSTKPSIASIMTSRYPTQHRAIYNADKLSDAHVTIAEIMRAAGFITAGFVENPTLDPVFGLSQGFDTWTLDARRHSGEDTLARDFDAKIEAWIEAHQDTPFLLYVHYIDPHSPYNAPEGYRGRFNTSGGDAPHEQLNVGTRIKEDPQVLIDRYDEEIPYMADRLSALVGYLKKHTDWDNTVFLFTTDHGEGFGEHHGYFHHSYGVYGELTNAPMVVRAPGRLSPGRSQVPVQHVDVLPTVLDLAGVEVKDHRAEGESVARVVERGGPPRFIMTEHLRLEWGIAQRGGILDRWKLVHHIEADTFALYDIAADPGETKDLAREQPERVKALKAALSDRLRGLKDIVDPTRAEDVDEEMQEALRNLGYIE